MNLTMDMPQLSTGVKGLDELLEGPRWGECLTFQSSRLEDFSRVLDSFSGFVEKNGIPLCRIYLEGTASVGVVALTGCNSKIVARSQSAPQQLADLISEQPPSSALCLLIDGEPAMEECVVADLFDRLTAAVLRRRAIAYVFLERGAFSNRVVAHMLDRTSIFFELWSCGEVLFLQPLKAAGRYSDKLFIPYQISNGKTSPATGQENVAYTQALEKKSREFLELYSQKRVVDQELQRKVHELSLINSLTSSLLSTIDLKEILYRILIGVTAKEGLEFNRAFLLLVNEAEQVLAGRMAIGPSSLEEAIQIWTDLSDRHLTYTDLLAAFDSGWQEHDAHVNELVKKIRVPLQDRSNVLISLLMRTQPEIIGLAETSPNEFEARKLLELLGARSAAVAPLVYRNRQLGLLIADNLISEKPITEDQLRILETFANYASTAIEHSRLYEEVRVRVKESERHILKLETMQDRLIRSKKLSDLGALASKMAHEIRTPLVSIGGFANALLKRQSPSSSDLEELQIIVDEVRRLEAIITNVLAYVSPGIPRAQTVNLQQLCDKVLKLMHSSFAAEKISILTLYPDNLPPLSVDPEQIQLVLTAIFNNAIESMRSGGSLTVTIEMVHDFVRLSISDTGGGIPKEDLSRVFEAFYTTKSLGSGLGLNIASQIIANHKGSIYVESQVGSGTTFSINFPINTHQTGVPPR